MSRTEWLIQYILGTCVCHEVYKSRELIAPDCSYCNNKYAAQEALLLAYQLGQEEQDKELINHEELKILREQMTKELNPG